MANLYQKQAVNNISQGVKTQDVKGFRQASKLTGSYAEQLQKEADVEIRQAEKIYRTGLRNSMTSGFNTMMSDPNLANNPNLLSQEMDKVAKEYVDNIQSDSIKLDFLADYELSKGSFLNKATQNAHKVQQEQYKSSMFDSIYSGISSSGLSFSNALNGKGTIDDLTAFKMAERDIIDAVNAKDEFGSYIFSDTQRLKMKKDYEDNLVSSMEVSFYEMPESEREIFINKLDNNTASLGIIEKDGEPYDLSLKESVSPEMYVDIKKKLKSLDMKLKSDKLKEQNLINKQNIASYMANPTKAGLDYILASNNSISETQKEKLTAMYNDSPNYVAESTKDGLLQADSLLDSLLETEFENQEAMFNSSINVMEKLNLLNKEEVLDKDTVDVYKQKASRIMADEQYKRSYEEIKPFRSAMMNVLELAVPIAGYLTGGIGTAMDVADVEMPNKARSRLAESEESRRAKQIVNETQALAYQKVDAGDIEGAKKEYQKGKKRLIWLVNPDFNNKEVGDIGVSNGMPYEVVGFGDDIIVKRVQK